MRNQRWSSEVICLHTIGFLRHTWVYFPTTNCFVFRISNGYYSDTDPGGRWVTLRYDKWSFRFFTMENYVDSIQIIVKLTYNGNTLTVMGWLHYLDFFWKQVLLRHSWLFFIISTSPAWSLKNLWAEVFHTPYIALSITMEIFIASFAFVAQQKAQITT